MQSILDNGSQTNFVTSQYIQDLQLCSNITKNITEVSGVSAISSSSNLIISLQIMSRTSTFTRKMEFVVLDKIRCNLSTSTVSSREICLPSGLILADPEYFQPNKIDMLIGDECFGELLKHSLIKMDYKQPTLHETTLEWVVAGKVRNNFSRQTNIAGYLCWFQ